MAFYVVKSANRGTGARKNRVGCSLLTVVLLLGIATALHGEPVALRAGAKGIPVVTGTNATEIEQFAASELSRYLEEITGAKFPVKEETRVPSSALVVGRAAVSAVDPAFSGAKLGDDAFLIRTMGNRVLIAGDNDRGTLYGVYRFLEKLGCRWFAPNFDFYGAAGGEAIPHIDAPTVGDWNIVERPGLKWRKLYIEEGRSHTTENLKQMVDWMAKAGMNVFDCPIDYQHHHHTEWDHWRSDLTPELRKRGILIEVGGHGYPNFLPPERYFSQHPEWFGVKDGKRTNDQRVVFATSNPEAVATFVANVRSYLTAHPEIDILDVWPPDGAEWSEAPEDRAMGSPSERQILLLNHLAQELKPDFPRLRLQFIAYETYTVPPVQNRPDPIVFMDYCPINRSFESPLYSSGYAANEEYFHNLEGWAGGVMDTSKITIYSYITKYGWRSLPVTVPGLIVDEVRRFQGMGIGGFATYSEPGNWATFELDHYIAALALWNPQLDPKQELTDYTNNRYGAAGPAVLSYLELLEEVAPHAIGIPGTELNVEKQRMMIRNFSTAAAILQQAHAAAAGNQAVEVLLNKLDHSCRYVQNEMDLRLAILLNQQSSTHGQLSNLTSLLVERSKILAEDPGDGVILKDGVNQ